MDSRYAHDEPACKGSPLKAVVLHARVETTSSACSTGDGAALLLGAGLPALASGALVSWNCINSNCLAVGSLLRGATRKFLTIDSILALSNQTVCTSLQDVAGTIHWDT
jgi:hypothetical protein